MRLTFLSLTALLLISLTGCVAASEVVREVLGSGLLEGLAEGTARAMLEANTDLSGTEIAALAGVIGTATRALVAKPVEAYVSKTWGSRAASA